MHFCQVTEARAVSARSNEGLIFALLDIQCGEAAYVGLYTLRIRSVSFVAISGYVST